MSDRRIIENVGGGWSVVGWAPDDANLIMQGIHFGQRKSFIPGKFGCWH